MIHNIKLILEYNGKNYSGWQKQPGKRTIQSEVEEAIKELTTEDVDLYASGRTDAGVHALGQVASFNTESKIEPDRLVLALNSKLPKDISILKASYEDMDFHARFSAKAKKYRYIIYKRPERSVFLSDTSYHVRYKLDFEKMKKEAVSLVGEHDFTSFVSSGSSAKSNVREIYFITVEEDGDTIVIEVCGNGFLYNMVRIIVGTLVDIGRGKIEMTMEDIINSKNRDMAGHTAPPQGLFLKEVIY